MGGGPPLFLLSLPLAAAAASAAASGPVPGAIDRLLYVKMAVFSRQHPEVAAAAVRGLGVESHTRRAAVGLADVGDAAAAFGLLRCILLYYYYLLLVLSCSVKPQSQPAGRVPRGRTLTLAPARAIGRVDSIRFDSIRASRLVRLHPVPTPQRPNARSLLLLADDDDTARAVQKSTLVGTLAGSTGAPIEGRAAAPGRLPGSHSIWDPISADPAPHFPPETHIHIRLITETTARLRLGQQPWGPAAGRTRRSWTA